MLKSVFLFLEFLTIIMGKESVRENHVGFPCRSADCSDSSPSSAAALSRPGAAGGLRAGGPGIRRGMPVLSPARCSQRLLSTGSRPGGPITCTSSWSLTNYKKNKPALGFVSTSLTRGSD